MLLPSDWATSRVPSTLQSNGGFPWHCFPRGLSDLSPGTPPNRVGLPQGVLGLLSRLGNPQRYQIIPIRLGELPKGSCVPLVERTPRRGPSLVCSTCCQAVLTRAWAGDGMTRFPLVQGTAPTGELCVLGGGLQGCGAEHGLLARSTRRLPLAGTCERGTEHRLPSSPGHGEVRPRPTRQRTGWTGRALNLWAHNRVSVSTYSLEMGPFDSWPSHPSWGWTGHC